MRLAFAHEGRLRSLRMSLRADLCACARSFLSSCKAATVPCASRQSEHARESFLGNCRVCGKYFRSVRQTYRENNLISNESKQLFGRQV